MEFSELWFLYIFLPLTMLIYLCLPKIRSKNIFLLIASVIFYALAQPICLLLLFWLTLMNHALSQRIVPGKAITVAAPIMLTLGTLVLFKVMQILPSVTASDVSLAERFGLPLGISYYTFQMIAYQIDIYRGKHEPSDRLSDMMLYAFLFPKIITGPIVRYADFAPQIEERTIGGEKLLRGLVRFVVGLAKKVLIADYCGDVITQLSGDGSGAGAWLCALMFMFQIYFEFSGCSDMAIGMANMFGFDFCENFNLPYTSASITDFWRRWHMSLGSFFRDYVYIPLGGNRKGKLRQVLNMLVVWTLTGLWHGTSWNYLLWGVYFFMLLAIEKQAIPHLQKIKPWIRWLPTMILVLLGWTIFSGQGLRSLFVFDRLSNMTVATYARNSMLLVITCVVGSSALPRKIATIWKKLSEKNRICKIIFALGMVIFAAALLWLCTVSLIGATNAPDIYGGKLR